MFAKIRLKAGGYLELPNLSSIKVLGMRLVVKQEYIGQDMLNFVTNKNDSYLFCCEDKAYNVPGEQIVHIEFDFD